MIEGDTALTPNQGAIAGSYGIARGGMQIRRAAAGRDAGERDRATRPGCACAPFPSAAPG
jgi:hypothetical protein